MGGRTPARAMPFTSEACAIRGARERTPARGPTPRPHYPRPYYATMPVLPVYSRGERGVAVGWMALVVARPPSRIAHASDVNGMALAGILNAQQTGGKPLICLSGEGSQLVQDDLTCELIACLVSTFRKKAQAAQSIVALIAQ